MNHPLDCPVCDKGGECPLQDQSLSHGPGESRFVEEKRHWAKPIEIGHFVALDRERCIQCARCTRFAAEVAGDAQIDFASRGSEIEVAPFPTEPFDSYFSGNTVQICPVGALTARPYRFRARPWDLEQVETTCTTCSFGCRVAAQSSAGAMVRLLGVDSEPVNQSWLCDKGRFAYEAGAAPTRLTSPELRRAGELVPVRWVEALNAAADALAGAGGDVGIIGGARLSNEDAYAWSRFARSVLRTDSVDAQIGDGVPAATVLSLPRATIDDAVTARVVLTLTGDLREELPVLYLRLRAAQRRGTTIIECSPVPSALSGLALRVPYLPGEAVRLAEALTSSSAPDHDGAGVPPGTALDDARALLAAREGEQRGTGVVVIVGRPSLAEGEQTIADAAALLSTALPGARFLPALRRANVLGALEMGLAPGVLPGRVTLEEGRTYYDAAWGQLPERTGLDTAEMLRRAATGGLRTLVLLGADPLSDFPDRELAQRALEAVPTVIALGTHRDPSVALADIVLPLPADGERLGTTTNIEGRVTRLAPKVIPPGVCWAPWVIASELASRLGGNLGFASIEEIAEEIANVVPTHRGVDGARLSRAHDGLIVPLDGATPVRAAPIDPMATPGITSAEEQGAPQRVGAVVPVGDAALPPTAPAVAPPTMLAISVLSEPVVAGRLDSYSYRLVVRRNLYDRGTAMLASHSLAGLAREAVLGVHPAELARLGLSSGERLRVRSAHGEIEITAEADERLPRAVVVTSANILGADALSLIAADELATDVRLETL